MDSERPQTSIDASQRRRLYAREARRKKRRRRFALGLVVALGAAGAIVGYYAAGTSSSKDTSTQLHPTSAKTNATGKVGTTTGKGPVPPPPRGLLTPADRGSFAGLERRLGGTSGVAVSGVGL